MKLRTLSLTSRYGCARAYVRVDWNIPLTGTPGTGELLKIARSLPLLEALHAHGVIAIVLTHLGRPKHREEKYSTRKLAGIVGAYTGLPIKFLDADVSTERGRAEYAKRLDRLVPGDIALLENVRFQPGEDTNDPKLIRAYAEHADFFINDAFASCHRVHATVVGLANVLPSYAGPALQEEVRKLEPLIKRPKRPYYAFIGGAKLSTKIPVIERLLKVADKVFVGGAMAHPFYVAQKKRVGKSLLDREEIPIAKKLLKQKKLYLPVDACVAEKLSSRARPRCVRLSGITSSDIIGDIGMETMKIWAQEIRHAKTLAWNGPFGVTELPAFSHGSLVIGRAIASRAKGAAYGVAGGGDTLPVVERTGMKEWFDWISTGGGAMLEFIALGGMLPGLKPLIGKGKVFRGMSASVQCDPQNVPAPRPLAATPKRRSNRTRK